MSCYITDFSFPVRTTTNHQPKWSGIRSNCRCCGMAVVPIHGLIFFFSGIKIIYSLYDHCVVEWTADDYSSCWPFQPTFGRDGDEKKNIVYDHNLYSYTIITNPSQPIAQTTYGFDGDQKKLAQNLLNIKVIRPRLLQSKILFELLFWQVSLKVFFKTLNLRLVTESRTYDWEGSFTQTINQKS